jgi:TonB family protein
MKVEIKEPCNESWENMKIGLVSRHCESCKKDVMDFTQKTRAEIILYLLSHPNDDVCGRMNSIQFDFHHDDIPVLIEAFKTNKTSTNASFLILTLVCLSLVSCSADNSGKKSKIDPPKESRIIKDLTVKDLQGEVSTPVQVQKKVSTKTNCAIQEAKKGELLLGEPAIEGMMIIEPTEVAGGISMEEIQKENTINQPLKFAEKMPEYSGGIDAMFVFILYPSLEKEEGIEGTVYLKIIVGEDGSISNPTVVRGINGHLNFEKEAIRVIQLMPKWIPGENGGKKVSVEYTLPFKFKLH